MSPPADLFDLTSKNVLVTGASRGIGLAIAQELARRGATVTITARKAEGLTAALGQFPPTSLPVLGLPCHQGDPAQVAGLFTQLQEQNRLPDVLVVNAATNPVYGPILDLDLEAWKKIVEVNLTGALLTAQLAARSMVSRRGGSIIFVASVAGIEPLAGLGAYSVSKAGLLGLMRTLARELGPFGVRVNALAPGLVETRFSQALFADAEVYRNFIARVPLGRHGQPDDIAGAALFLASDASRYITGQTLIIDGGLRV